MFSLWALVFLCWYVRIVAYVLRAR